jgi:hypothetical protein
MTEAISGTQENAPTADAAIPDASTAEFVITVDHVYLPLDEDGNGRADWATTSEQTAKVAKRERLQVPTDLAKHLSERDQAEIL